MKDLVIRKESEGTRIQRNQAPTGLPASNGTPGRDTGRWEITPTVVSQESCNAALNLSWECHTLAQGCRWDLCVLHSHVRTPPHRQCREAEVVVERERMGVKELDAPAEGMANKSNGNGISFGFLRLVPLRGHLSTPGSSPG